MARNGSTTLSLPPFSGATRRLILILVGVFFADAILARLLPIGLYDLLFGHLALIPAELLRGQIWRLATYSLFYPSIMGTLFACLTIWFVGSLLESERGSQWLLEMFFASAVGGGAIAALIAFTRIFGLNPAYAVGLGPSAAILGWLVALAVLMGDLEFFIFFLIRIRVKYLVIIYILVDLATLLKEDNAFSALLHLCGGLSGYLYLRYAPRRGYGFSFSERYYALRNEYYRRKRRNAAKKFEVYMGKQGRDVHFDSNGRYVEPDEKDPNDKRWMN